DRDIIADELHRAIAHDEVRAARVHAAEAQIVVLAIRARLLIDRGIRAISVVERIHHVLRRIVVAILDVFVGARRGPDGPDPLWTNHPGNLADHKSVGRTVGHVFEIDMTGHIVGAIVSRGDHATHGDSAALIASRRHRVGVRRPGSSWGRCRAAYLGAPYAHVVCARIALFRPGAGRRYVGEGYFAGALAGATQKRNFVIVQISGIRIVLPVIV